MILKGLVRFSLEYFLLFLLVHLTCWTYSGPEVLFKTCVAMKFVDDDDDYDWRPCILARLKENS